MESIDIYNISKDYIIDENWLKDHEYNIDEIDFMIADNVTINIKNK